MFFVAGMFTILAGVSRSEIIWGQIVFALLLFPMLLLETGIYYWTRNHPQLPGLQWLHIGCLVMAILGLWIFPVIGIDRKSSFIITEWVILIVGHLFFVVNLALGIARR